MSKLFPYVINNALIMLMLATLVGTARAADDQHAEAEQQAVAAAETWLATVDKGEYGESWDAAASYLQAAVSKESFAKALSAVRTPLGSVVKRQLKSKHYRTSLPGAPDGEYVVLQFETSFENKKEALETITPMLGKDGAWKVSGYFIK